MTARMRWPSSITAVLAAAVLTACGGARAASSPSPPAGPAVAPPFDLPTLDGARLSLASFRGRPLLLNFWASNCAPCRKELPALQAAEQRAGGRVAFLGVDEQDVAADARRLLADSGVTYSSVVDGAGSLEASYRLFGLPTTVLVGPDGRVRDRVTGPLSRSRLDELLGKAA